MESLELRGGLRPDLLTPFSQRYTSQGKIKSRKRAFYDMRQRMEMSRYTHKVKPPMQFKAAASISGAKTT